MQVNPNANLAAQFASLANQATAQYQDGQPFQVFSDVLNNATGGSATGTSTASTGTNGTGTATGTTGTDANGYELSGNFHVEMIEKAGDDALFTPGAPGAPAGPSASGVDRGQQEFSNSLQNFLTLAEAGASQNGSVGSSSFHTENSFSGDGGNIGMVWSGDFQLTPTGPDGTPQGNGSSSSS